ncbi:MAG: TIGR00289 family protein [Candidatus Diapherotrites archaeon CG10_big_fil_rev_8_21_14_0_10_31_34]|nr:MAG: TIGR00289 family protein [Candidatus Diapherotrites archaeon CG10_big_fil_rev_8_21_14_0_10_31_34]PJA18234.1 MAG: TIGR00289 family protein [Candidatus Diapherotrites archaeon CG_4_10_14_0_2_um_filter_31_5]
MKLAGLFSGGKDSCYAVDWALNQNHKVNVLVSIVSENPYSYMFHTPNIKLTSFQGLAAEIPVMYKTTPGIAEKELKELKHALAEAKENFSVKGITTGALASSYQKNRVESICSDLGLKCFSPLWQKNQTEYVQELISNGFEVLIVGVAAQGLGENWLGRKLDESILNRLIELDKKIGLNVAGEGGEYETFVLDAPFFKKKIEVIDSVNHWQKDSGYLEIKKIKLVEK